MNAAVVAGVALDGSLRVDKKLVAIDNHRKTCASNDTENGQ